MLIGLIRSQDRTRLRKCLGPMTSILSERTADSSDKEVARRVLEARAGDGSEALDAYRPKTRPAQYVPTPITVASMWPKLKPFCHDELLAISAATADIREERAVGNGL
jgi:hypothetical protein